MEIIPAADLDNFPEFPRVPALPVELPTSGSTFGPEKFIFGENFRKNIFLQPIG